MAPPEIMNLLKKAAEVASNAHATYSDFRVGAALEAEDGTVFVGCNVENASYGLTMCAERSAVFNAVAHGARSFSRLAVVASGNSLPYPCGACRQVLSEFCSGELLIVVAEKENLQGYEETTLRELLPKAFRLEKQ